MRLFLALDIDEASRAAIGAAAAEIARRLSKLGAGGAVKWVTRENLHLTLRFLGEVDEATVPLLLKALEPQLPIAAFDLVLGGGGCFPPGGPPRVVWVAVTSGAEDARRIYTELDRRVSAFDVERDQRPYTPHLTLGRVREIPRAPGTSLRTWASELSSPLGHVRVTAATLFRSRLSPNGASYERVLQIPLTGGEGR